MSEQLDRLLAEAKRLQQLGRLEAAEMAYREVLALVPDQVEALNNRGNVLRGLKRPEEAVASLQRALALKPDHPAVLSNLGLALGDLARFEDAAECQRHAVAADPDFAAGHNNLGLALKELGRPAEAEASYRRALALKPDFAEALNNLGNALRVQERLEAAAGVYRRAIEIKPHFADAHFNLASALRDLGRQEEGEPHFRRALELSPEHAEVHLDRGKTLQRAGKIDDARSAFVQAIARSPALIEAHKSLIFALNEKPDPLDLARLEELACREGALPLKDRVLLHFTLARAYELLERYSESFESLLKANRLRRSQIDYNAGRERENVASLKRSFGRRLLAAKAGEGSPSELPIFIVGFPRSGTTLTEQILASHPQVFGAGELGFLGEIAAGLSAAGDPALKFPSCLPQLSSRELCQAGEDYVARLRALAPAAGRVTDKMPENYHFIGLIRLILPKARILHIRRHPLDSCLSCFAQNFIAGISFAYDLSELGDFYRCYLELMAHWRAALPEGAMLELRYEELVEDLEGQARRILDYCGLPWDERCLAFHRTERPVKTASMIQVRQPLYRSSVARWRRYEKHLAPLLETLGPAATAYPTNAS